MRFACYLFLLIAVACVLSNAMVIQKSSEKNRLLSNKEYEYESGNESENESENEESREVQTELIKSDDNQAESHSKRPLKFNQDEPTNEVPSVSESDEIEKAAMYQFMNMVDV